MQNCADASGLIGITDEPLAIERILQRLQEAAGGGAGAIVPFIGIVRDNSLGHKVERLEYEAYAPMALLEMSRIAEEVRYQWGAPCAIWHRVGTLSIGEASVFVATATPHRPEAFEAARYAIDTVKATVPVWKKEIATDGSWWVEDPLQALTTVG